MKLAVQSGGACSSEGRTLSGQAPSDVAELDAQSRYGRALWLLDRLSASAMAFVIISVLVALSFLTFPRYTLANDVESGWSSVLDYVHAQGLQHGTEIVFPYGPLGYLFIPHFAVHTDGLRLMFDCVLCYLISAGVCLLAWRFRFGWRLLTIGAFTLVVTNKPYGTQDLLLNIGFLSWGLLCLTESRPRLALYSVLLVLLATVASLAKISFFFSAASTVGVVSLDLFLRRKRWFAVAVMAGFGVGVFVLWRLAGQNPANLPIYFTRVLAMCKGYDQAMALQPGTTVLASGITVAFLAVASACSRCLTGCQRDGVVPLLRPWLVLAWLVSILFLSWKHGFLRGDPHHSYYFFGFAALFVLLLEAFVPANIKVRPWVYGVAALACVAAVASLQLSLVPNALRLDLCVSQLARNFNSFLRPAAYSAQMSHWQSQEQRELNLPEVRKIVGGAAVDVFGNYQTYAVLNELNYRPRPVFQSYAAYSPFLSQLNESFYRSANAPQYVLATLEPIDQRFGPMEDPLLLRELLINFRLRATEGGFLLLQTNSRAKPVLTLLREETIKSGERINLSSFGETNLWMEIKVEPTTRGRVRQLLYQPASVHMGVWGAPPDSPPKEFRAPVPMMASGFIASPLLSSKEDLLALYEGKPVTRPTAYSVEFGPGSSFWRSRIQVRIYGIENSFAGRAANGTATTGVTP